MTIKVAINGSQKPEVFGTLMATDHPNYQSKNTMGCLL